MSSLLWIGLAIVLGIIELMSTTFVIMWIAIAGVITGIIGFFVPNFLIQVIVFTLISIVLLLITRPLVKKFKKRGGKFNSHVDELVGEKGMIISRIAPAKTGMVRVGTDMWSARGQDPEDAMDVGEWVQVKEVHSSILIVGKL
nr:NfeD family protein [Bacilli bacterium]